MPEKPKELKAVALSACRSRVCKGLIDFSFHILKYKLHRTFDISISTFISILMCFYKKHK